MSHIDFMKRLCPHVTIFLHSMSHVAQPYMKTYHVALSILGVKGHGMSVCGGGGLCKGKVDSL